MEQKHDLFISLLVAVSMLKAKKKDFFTRHNLGIALGTERSYTHVLFVFFSFQNYFDRNNKLFLFVLLLRRRRPYRISWQLIARGIFTASKKKKKIVNNLIETK